MCYSILQKSIKNLLKFIRLFNDFLYSTISATSDKALGARWVLPGPNSEPSSGSRRPQCGFGV